MNKIGEVLSGIAYNLLRILNGLQADRVARGELGKQLVDILSMG